MATQATNPTIAQAMPQMDYEVSIPVQPPPARARPAPPSRRVPTAPEPEPQQWVGQRGRTWTDWTRTVPTPNELANQVEEHTATLGEMVARIEAMIHHVRRASTWARAGFGLALLALLAGGALLVTHGTPSAGATTLSPDAGEIIAALPARPLPPTLPPTLPPPPPPTLAPTQEAKRTAALGDRVVQPGEGIAAYEARLHLPAGAVRLWLVVQGRTTLFAGEEPDPAAVAAAGAVVAAAPAAAPPPAAAPHAIGPGKGDGASGEIAYTGVTRAPFVPDYAPPATPVPPAPTLGPVQGPGKSDGGEGTIPYTGVTRAPFAPGYAPPAPTPRPVQGPTQP